jgi:hypothetical protein
MGICTALSPAYPPIRVRARLVAGKLNETGGAAEAYVVSGESLEEAHQAATTDTAYPDGLTAAPARTHFC